MDNFYLTHILREINFDDYDYEVIVNLLVLEAINCKNLPKYKFTYIQYVHKNGKNGSFFAASSIITRIDFT